VVLRERKRGFIVSPQDASAEGMVGNIDKWPRPEGQWETKDDATAISMAPLRTKTFELKPEEVSAELIWSPPVGSVEELTEVGEEFGREFDDDGGEIFSLENPRDLVEEDWARIEASSV
jgi:hypothetical protein